MKKKTLLLMTCIIWSLFFSQFIVQISLASPPYDGTWEITGTPINYTSQNYEVNYPIIIKTGSDIEFVDCTFDFSNESGSCYILVEGSSILRLENCEFTGLEIGNSYFDVEPNSDLIVENCVFSNVGKSGHPAIFFQGQNMLLSNTSFSGKYANIDAFSISSTNIDIDSCNFDDDDAKFASAIHLEGSNNIEISNCNIDGYLYGIELFDCHENIAISNSTIINQEIDSISAMISGVIAPDEGIHIANNNLTSNRYCINLENGEHSNIINNTVKSKVAGLQFVFGMNQTISENNITISEFGEKEFAAISLRNAVDLKIENNSFNINENNTPNPVKFYDVQGSYIDAIFQQNNTFNGKQCYIFFNENNYSIIHDFSSEKNLGSISLWNCIGINIKHADLSDSGSLQVINSEDLILENITITNSLEKLICLNSENCSISNSSMVNNYEDQWSPILLDTCTNFTISNLNLICEESIECENGIEIWKGNNITITDSNITNTINGIRFMRTNGSLFENNRIKCEFTLSCFSDSHYNNITYNEMIKWNTGINDEQFIFDNFEDTENNLWDYNHWSEYFAANDTDPEDGIADNSFTLVEFGLNKVSDNYPLFIDDDSDGLDYFQEVGYYNTDPNDADSDNDLIYDGEEVKVGVDGYITNPLNNDTDADNLSDYDEIVGTYGNPTNPRLKDTDGDMFTDYYELIFANSNPVNSTDFPGADLNNANGEEVDVYEQERSENTRGTIPGYYQIFLISAITGGLVYYFLRNKIKIFQSKFADKTMNKHGGKYKWD